MNTDVIVIIVEDDLGHAALIKKNLKRAGINNEIIHFVDGREVLDYFFEENNGRHVDRNRAYLMLLDIRMPNVDGVEVLRRVKSDDVFKKIPVIMLTTTDDPREIESCHKYGCSNYIAKPVDYDKFVNAVRQLGLFLSVVEVPLVGAET